MHGALAVRERANTALLRLTPAEVERRILRACKTIRALPDRERKFQITHNAWPDMVRDVADAYGYTEERMPRFNPSPADVSDCLVALEWVRGLNRQEWRLIWARSFGFSFRHIGLRIGRSDETARRFYRDAILNVWMKACASI